MAIDPGAGSTRDYLATPVRRVVDRAMGFEQWRSARERAGLMPYAKYLIEPPRASTTLQYSDGRRFSGINFATQDYLSLASHPAVMTAATEAIQRFGVHSAGSTALAGNVHEALRLEAEISELLHTRHTLLFPTGWAAGYGVIRGLVRETDHVVLDVLAHNCLQEGAMAATRNLYRIRHRDLAMTRHRLSTIRAHDPANAIVVVTEGIFSMDADVPDLRAFQALCREYEATLIVDVAHDLGCMGPDGSGQIGVQGMLGEIDIVMGSFSKTFASNGGFVSCNSRAIKEYLRYYAPSNTFSNALSPIQIAVVQTALGIVRAREGEALRQRLHTAVVALRQGLSDEGLRLYGEPHAIVPMAVGSEAVARRATMLAARNDVLVNLSEFPAVPINESRFRLQVMATHEPDDCRAAAKLIATSVRQAEADIAADRSGRELEAA
ncbi:aminotransferase class I/II-fold pyridoxal phosphate-dependent enzyme [Nevskia sp.]|uniref:aminotransferase class I/II-fold pyridoxal phosphate-dependent enzyme n=1 Tax=Nevskia sp. TaxID=1929292 RepID=UPI0025D8D1C6|nr:aminotransferase class I/II-fold pyridoxal phosphate-dependent enzyme [Nevskia sp.]